MGCTAVPRTGWNTGTLEQHMFKTFLKNFCQDFRKGVFHCSTVPPNSDPFEYNYQKIERKRGNMTKEKFWLLNQIADETIAETEFIRSSRLYTLQERLFAELRLMWAGADLIRAGEQLNQGKKNS